MNFVIRLLVAMSALVQTHVVQAAWMGTGTVLSGGWGSEPNQFAIEYSDSETIFPLVTDVSSEGRIAISDEYNGRMKVYASDGSLLWNIVPPVDDPFGWAMTPKFIGQNLVVPVYKYFFYSASGELLAQPESPGKSIFKGERNGILYVANTEPTKRWLTYSPSGELLNTYTEKPLALGRIADDLFIYQGQKLHRVTVSFPNDRKWTIPDKHGSCGEYAYRVDSAGNLYCVGQQVAERYSICGKKIAAFSLPKPRYEVVATPPEGLGIDPVSELIEEYAGVVLGDDGSIYASRATQENFSVVRWTWENSPDDPMGGPDAPVELTATASDGAVALRWIPSLQDPGCVSGYEVGRATSAGGPYTALATVAQAGVDQPYTYTDTTAQSGTTYYYAVRAVSSIANSPYSNEAIAQVP